MPRGLKMLKICFGQNGLVQFEGIHLNALLVLFKQRFTNLIVRVALKELFGKPRFETIVILLFELIARFPNTVHLMNLKFSHTT